MLLQRRGVAFKMFYSYVYIYLCEFLASVITLNQHKAYLDWSYWGPVFLHCSLDIGMQLDTDKVQLWLEKGEGRATNEAQVGTLIVRRD